MKWFGKRIMSSKANAYVLTILLVLSISMVELTPLLQQGLTAAADGSPEINLAVSRTMPRSTGNSLLAGVDSLVSMAMTQLTAPLALLNQRIGSSTSAGCRQLWDVNELRQRINFQIRSCAADMSNIMEGFRADGDTSGDSTQTLFGDIGNFPILCQALQSMPLLQSLLGNLNCVPQSTGISNAQTGKALNIAKTAQIRTRQIAALSIRNVQQCSREVVEEVSNQINDALQYC